MTAPQPSQPAPGSAVATPAASAVAPAAVGPDGQPPGRLPDLMQSLSQAAAISLQEQQAAAAAAVAATATATPAVVNAMNGVNHDGNNNKRPAEDEATGAPPASIVKT